MFENYKQMSAEEQAQVRAIHKAIRKETTGRYGNLAWGFVRGLPYRRIERKTQTQVMADGTVIVHNRPHAANLTYVLAKHIPELAGPDKWRANPLIEAWLACEEGALPAPPPRTKRTEEARQAHLQGAA